jgi:hypothetical protein
VETSDQALSLGREGKKGEEIGIGGLSPAMGSSRLLPSNCCTGCHKVIQFASVEEVPTLHFGRVSSLAGQRKAKSKNKF